MDVMMQTQLRRRLAFLIQVPLDVCSSCILTFIAGKICSALSLAVGMQGLWYVLRLGSRSMQGRGDHYIPTHGAQGLVAATVHFCPHRLFFSTLNTPTGPLLLTITALASFSVIEISPARAASHRHMRITNDDGFHAHRTRRLVIYHHPHIRLI